MAEPDDQILQEHPARLAPIPANPIQRTHSQDFGSTPILIEPPGDPFQPTFFEAVAQQRQQQQHDDQAPQGPAPISTRLPQQHDGLPISRVMRTQMDRHSDGIRRQHIEKVLREMCALFGEPQNPTNAARTGLVQVKKDTGQNILGSLYLLRGLTRFLGFSPQQLREVMSRSLRQQKQILHDQSIENQHQLVVPHLAHEIALRDRNPEYIVTMTRLTDEVFHSQDNRLQLSVDADVTQWIAPHRMSIVVEMLETFSSSELQALADHINRLQHER